MTPATQSVMPPKMTFENCVEPVLSLDSVGPLGLVAWDALADEKPHNAVISAYE